MINGKPANLAQGLAIATLACAMRPNSAIAHIRSGEAHEKLGNKPQSVFHYRKVLELEANNKDAQERLTQLGAFTEISGTVNRQRRKFAVTRTLNGFL